jgi:spore coat polysaccharide biosynthesis protein SpsF (cytidylyltransferase family)
LNEPAGGQKQGELNKSITIIIQARVASTRLRGKMLMPFYRGRTILELLVEKLLASQQLGICLATSDDASDVPLVELGRKYPIEVFRGDNSDVLHRFVECAEYLGTDKIIRICADNPFLHMPYLNLLLDNYIQDPCDYMSFCTQDNIPVIRTHFGFWSEAVSADALKWVRNNIRSPQYHEHVTNYLYENPESFNVKFIQIPTFLSGRNDIRLTIDTQKDFEISRQLYEVWVEDLKEENLSDLIAYIDGKPELRQAMIEEIQKNTK